MNKSEQIGELYEALSKMQGALKSVPKNGRAHQERKYCTLEDVWETVRKPLSDNGLAVTQAIEHHNDQFMLITELGHKSGQWMRSFCPLMMKEQTSQGFGSAVTYARRYGLVSLLGVCPDEDDDGEKAVKSKQEPIPVETNKPKKTVEPKTAEVIELITRDQKSDLELSLVGFKDLRSTILERLGVDQLYKVPASKYDDIVGWVKKQKEKAA
jgi:hypothetical protein